MIERLVTLALVPLVLATATATAYVVAAHELYRWFRA